jgi:putative transposase
MFVSYRTEIKPDEVQKSIINKTNGVCRYLYNLYVSKNKDRLDNSESLITGYDFSKWINNVYSVQEEYNWIKDVSSKAAKQSIMNAERAFKSYFKNKTGMPRYKTKSDYESFYLIGTIKSKRNYIQLPTLGKVRLKEYGYIPAKNIKSCTVIKEFDRYFVSVLVEENKKPNKKIKRTDGIGIDVGIKSFLYDSEGKVVANPNKSITLVKLLKSLKRQQRSLARKRKGSSNWIKQKLKVQRLFRRITNIKRDMKKKIANEITKHNPKFITIEDLNIKGMLKNRRLSNAFQQIGIGYFVEFLKHKCLIKGIELRQVNRFYPSSQLCSRCGNKKKMPLELRTYKCDKCNEELDRDYNASINLRLAEDYTVLV